jgi:hypothetical protein
MRPTKYCPEIVQRAKEYVDGAYLEEGEVLPTIEGLSLYLDISRDTVYAWGKHEDRQAFSDILGTVMAKQGRELLNGGLKGTYNPTITKLMLTKHDYSDKSQSEVSGPDGGPIQTDTEFRITVVSPEDS